MQTTERGSALRRLGRAILDVIFLPRKGSEEWERQMRKAFDRGYAAGSRRAMEFSYQRGRREGHRNGYIEGLEDASRAKGGPRHAHHA